MGMDEETLKTLGLSAKEFEEREKQYLATLEASTKKLRHVLSNKITFWKNKNLVGRWERNFLYKRMSDTYFLFYALPDDFPEVRCAYSPQDRVNLQHFIGAYLLSFTGGVDLCLDQEVPSTQHLPISVASTREEALNGRLILYNYLRGLDETSSSISKERSTFKGRSTLEERLTLLERRVKELEKKC